MRFLSIMFILLLGLGIVPNIQAQVDTIDTSGGNQTIDRTPAPVIGTLHLPKPLMNQVSLSNFDFQSLRVDSTRTRLISVVNTDDKALRVLVFSSNDAFIVSTSVLYGPPTGPLGKISRQLTDTLNVASGDSAFVGVTFAPLTDGFLSSTLTVRLDSSQSDTLAVSLSGTGTQINGEVLIDLDTAEGNQRLTRTELTSTQTATLQLFAQNLPESSLFDLKIEFDAGFLTYIHNSFSPGEVLPNSSPSIQASQKNNQGLLEIAIGSPNGPVWNGNNLSSFGITAADSERSSVLKWARLNYLHEHCVCLTADAHSPSIFVQKLGQLKNSRLLLIRLAFDPIQNMKCWKPSFNQVIAWSSVLMAS